MIPRREGEFRASASARSSVSDPVASDSLHPRRSLPRFPPPRPARASTPRSSRARVTVKCPGDRRFDADRGRRRSLLPLPGGHPQGPPADHHHRRAAESCSRPSSTRASSRPARREAGGRSPNCAWPASCTRGASLAARRSTTAEQAGAAGAALGPRPRPLPHQRPPRLGLGPRHHLAGRGPQQQHHLLQGHPGPGDGARLRPPPQRQPRRARAKEELHREAAPALGARQALGHGLLDPPGEVGRVLHQRQEVVGRHHQ